MKHVKYKLIGLFLSISMTLVASISVLFAQNLSNTALFFAIDDYSDNPVYGDLSNPIKDVAAIAGELKEMYGFSTYIYKNQSKGEIYATLQEWQKHQFSSQSQLLIFFSGHGDFWEFTKKGYFIPQTQESDYSAFIQLTDLANIITQIQCRNILLAVDACYSGTLDQAIAFKGSGQVQTGSSRSYIKTLLDNKSRLLITSGGKERTPEGERHSPFSEAILRALRGNYTTDDGILTFRELLSHLERVHPKPHQGKFPGHENGSFVFISNNVQLSSASDENRGNEERSIGYPNDRMATSVTDSKGNEYPVLPMKDGKLWLGKNLNFEWYDSYCYKEDPKNCEKYGRLYIWSSAMEACKTLGDGWRLPSDLDWAGLMKAYDERQGNSSLLENGSSGLNLQAAGIKERSFTGLRSRGSYWTSMEEGGMALTYSFVSEEQLRYLFRGGSVGKRDSRSVRCVHD